MSANTDRRVIDTISELAGVADVSQLPVTVVYTTGSYADPAWIASISGEKVTGDIAGNAATATTAVTISGSITEGQVAGLTTALAARALDAAVVHNAGDETIAGKKSFTDRVTFDFDDSSSSLAAPHAFGGQATGGAAYAVRFQLDSDTQSIQTGFGQRVQFSAWWGIEIGGNRQGDPLAFASGGASDPSLTVIGTQPTARVLRVVAAPGQAGHVFEVTSDDRTTVLGSIDAAGNLAVAGTITGDGSGLTGLPTATSGAATLAAGYSIAASAAWEDPGVSVALPSAGTYLVTANVRGFIVVTGGGGYLTYRLLTAPRRRRSRPRSGSGRSIYRAPGDKSSSNPRSRSSAPSPRHPLSSSR